MHLNVCYQFQNEILNFISLCASIRERTIRPKARAGILNFMRGAYFERAILFFWNILLQFTIEGIISVGLFIKDVFMVMEKGAASKYS